MGLISYLVSFATFEIISSLIWYIIYYILLVKSLYAVTSVNKDWKSLKVGVGHNLLIVSVKVVLLFNIWYAAKSWLIYIVYIAVKKG